MSMIAKPLRAATCEVIRTFGVGILDDPDRCLGALVDLIDGDSAEAKVLYDNCDQRLLSRFSAAAKRCSAEDLESTYKGTVAYLTSECYVGEDAAQLVARGLAQGIADGLGIDISVEPERKTETGPVNPPHEEVPPVRPIQYPPPVQPSPRPRRWPKVVLGIVILLVIATAGVLVYVLMGKTPTYNNPVTISFNANGADSGTVDSITCESGEAMPLPSGISLKRAGYTFAGWGDERDDNTPHGVGESFSTTEDTTLYAQWNPGEESKPKIVGEKMHVTDSGNKVIVLTVNNASAAAVDLQVEFSFLNAAGNVVDSSTADAWSVGPGETTILEASSAVSDIDNITYNVRSSSPKYSDTSLLSCATVEEVSCNDSGLTVRVTNKSGKTATLVSCVAYGYEGERFAYVPVNYEVNEQSLEPGESRTVVFQGSQWTSLDHKVYLFGFAR